MVDTGQDNTIRKPKLGWTLAVIGVGLALIIGSIVWWQYDETSKEHANINSFQACKDAGGMIAESYPEQCSINGMSFTNDAQSSGEADQYVGLTEQEALDKAEQNNKTARVVERDGESLTVTMDLMLGRLNFSVKDDRVYKVEVEGESE